MTSFLSEIGYVVHEAEHGEAALALQKKEAPRLTILDLNMPGVSGLELLRQLLEADRSARIGARAERDTHQLGYPERDGRGGDPGNHPLIRRGDSHRSNCTRVPLSDTKKRAVQANRRHRQAAVDRHHGTADLA